MPQGNGDSGKDRRWRRRWDAFRPYLPVAVAGLLGMVAGSILEHGRIGRSFLSPALMETVGGALRAVGGAAITASVVAPAVTRRVQQNANRQLLRGFFQVLLGVNVPEWFAQPLARCIGSIRRITNFRHWSLTLEFVTEDIVAVHVDSTGHGVNVSKDEFVFEDLRAPASVEPFRTSFEKIFLRTYPGDRPQLLSLEDETLLECLEEDDDGRSRIDLRRHRAKATVGVNGEYRLEQQYTVFCPGIWAYLIESYGAHREQKIEIRGPALKALEIRVLHANEQLHPRRLRNGDLLYSISNTTFPGQTTVVSWRRRRPVEMEPHRAEKEPIESRLAARVEARRSG